MRFHKARNGRLTARGNNGRFKKATISEVFGLTEVNSGEKFICSDCGYGKDEDWMPIVYSGACPVCQSKNKTKKTK